MESSNRNPEEATGANNTFRDRIASNLGRMAGKLRDIAVVTGLICLPSISGLQGSALPSMGELMDKANAGYVLVRMSVAQQLRDLDSAYGDARGRGPASMANGANRPR